jgi:hypothetical protein
MWKENKPIGQKHRENDGNRWANGKMMAMIFLWPSNPLRRRPTGRRRSYFLRI